MRKLFAIGAVVAIAITVSACAQPGGPGFGFNKQTGGAILGGAGGALAGSQFGTGQGRLAATALGTLLGAWAGSEAGASMDRADQNYYGYRAGPQIQWTQPRGYDSYPPRY